MKKLIVKGESTGANLEKDVFIAYLPFAPKCEKCDNIGMYFVPNGEDDAEATYCYCPRGRAKEMNEYIKALAQEKTV